MRRISLETRKPPDKSVEEWVSEQFAINSGAHVLESRVIRWFHDFELH